MEPTQLVENQESEEIRRSLVRSLIDSGTPRWKSGHLLDGLAPDSSLLFVTEQSQVYDVRARTAAEFKSAWEAGDTAGLDSLLERSIQRKAHASRGKLPESEQVRALSLAVAQKCNLGCTYCYAKEGNFGGAAKHMPIETAVASIDRLLRDAEPGGRANLAFMGGEPLTNRAVVHAATDYAASRAAELSVDLGFSITTNGTLIEEEDGALFENHGFAVTISLDGVGREHDALRPTKGGGATYDRVIANIRPLLSSQEKMQVSARATITPSNLKIRDTLDEFIGMGFHTVGFSPMLSSPTGRGEMDSASLDLMLAEMVECGLEFERNVAAHRRYPFLNMVNAMKEIHAGSNRPLPCGAGDGYLGVGADGSLAACHRFVGEKDAEFGSITRGLDLEAQRNWRESRIVDRQEPCKDCWARYLCGGGCHYEVNHRGRDNCGFIRGWLSYCLQAYTRLIERRPDYFGCT